MTDKDHMTKTNNFQWRGSYAWKVQSVHNENQIAPAYLISRRHFKHVNDININSRSCLSSIIKSESWIKGGLHSKIIMTALAGTACNNNRYC